MHICFNGLNVSTFLNYTTIASLKEIPIYYKVLLIFGSNISVMSPNTWRNLKHDNVYPF